MTTYNGPTPNVVNRAINANVHQNQTLSYEFRVVEHVNDEGKVIAYIMQTRVWAHDPPDANGLKAVPILVQDWTDVPRVQMKDGQVVTAPQKSPPQKSPPPLSQATAQKQTSNGGTNTVPKSNGSADSWPRPSTFWDLAMPPANYETQYDMKAIANMLGDDYDKRAMG